MDDVRTSEALVERRLLHQLSEWRDTAPTVQLCRPKPKAGQAFRIDDTVNPAPSDCLSPVLLIRSSGNGVWFAVGIRKFGDDD